MSTGANESTAACAAGCPQQRLGTRLVTVAGWLVAALAALSTAAIPFDFGESLCGPWGCLPPLSALVAIHLFWFVAAGALVRSTTSWRGDLRQVAGSVLVGSAIAAGALVIGTDLYDWFGRGSAAARVYWPQRVAFRFATATDVPILQLLFAGTACLVRANRARARATGGTGMM